MTNPERKVVVQRTDPETIVVKCEQCGRWTPVEVRIGEMVVEIVKFQTHYRVPLLTGSYDDKPVNE